MPLYPLQSDFGIKQHEKINTHRHEIIGKITV